jgi:N-acetylglucosaminyldiphosphoundecaprenol N-acetyl-beta-D-mannosaminyltransferase
MRDDASSASLLLVESGVRESEQRAQDVTSLPDRGSWRQQEFLGIPFSTVSFHGTVDTLQTRPATRPFAYVATPNAQHVTHFNRGDPDFGRGLRGAWVLTCDSQVVRGLARLLFGVTLPLVTGSDLTDHLFRFVITPDEPVTIIGGNAALAAALRDRFGLRRIALHDPPFGFGHDVRELDRCARFIREHPARFVFIACGAPQSEMLAAHVVAQGGATGIGLCVGASLSFVTGRLKRAPKIWQRLGMEWLHRLLCEPRRLGRRLLRGQLPLLWLVARARISPATRRLETSGAP